MGEVVEPYTVGHQLRCVPRGQSQRYNGKHSEHKAWAPRKFKHELTTSGEPDDGKAIKSGSVGSTRKPTGAILQGGGCLPYAISVLYLLVDGMYLGEAYCTQLMGGRSRLNLYN